ncbi:MAG: helix-hairpin-helix domain-containing protein [Phycisphaerales bacterium]|nr:MAG: helix-hairpin-helix domain-containing protein [Phycisphaerales bacterium]
MGDRQDSSVHLRAVHSAALFCLGLVMLTALLRGVPWDVPSYPFPEIQTRVDPNTAPWWELSILPGIGETIARRIVRFREAAVSSPHHEAGRPVFACVADLRGVRGIGPVKSGRMGPHLTFPD